MAKKNFDKQIKEKISLGELISKLRQEKKVSLRRFAETIGLPPSNLSYIEKGINVPSAEIYQRIVDKLEPSEQEHKKLDELYIIIRNVPPPDVCGVLVQNIELGEKIKLLSNIQLTSTQLESIEKLFLKFNNYDNNCQV